MTRKKKADSEELVRRLNAQRLTGDDLQRIFQQEADVGPHCAGFERTARIISETFRDWPQDFRMAVSFRMTALARTVELVESFGVSFLKRPNGSMMINGALWSAAAEIPLVDRDDDPWLDSHDLFRRARQHELVMNRPDPRHE